MKEILHMHKNIVNTHTMIGRKNNETTIAVLRQASQRGEIETEEKKKNTDSSTISIYTLYLVASRI